MYLRALDGARRVEQMVRVRHYDAREDRWVRRCVAGAAADRRR